MDWPGLMSSQALSLNWLRSNGNGASGPDRLKDLVLSRLALAYAVDQFLPGARIPGIGHALQQIAEVGALLLLQRGDVVHHVALR